VGDCFYAHDFHRATAVADIGCGSGAIAARVASTGVPVIAVDVSWGMATATKSKLEAVAGHGLVVQADAASGLPLRSRSLGGIICMQVLNVVSDAPSTVAELRRVLAPRGMVLAEVVGEFLRTTVPNEMRPLALWTAKEILRRTPMVTTYSCQESDILFEASGFRVITHDHWHGNHLLVGRAEE
jgi:ubiquinone/menaquinone biosynthesis C-methylase UbiE